jgi:hypothetical protein
MGDVDREPDYANSETTPGGSAGESNGQAYIESAALWTAAAIDLKTKLAGIHVGLLLMCGPKVPWVAPRVVEKQFAGKLLHPFPDCIGGDNPTPGCIARGDVSSTMFACDRAYGKRVGNDNDDKTTGGVFGMYVPMHFTATEFPAEYGKNPVLEVLTMNKQQQ